MKMEDEVLTSGEMWEGASEQNMVDVEEYHFRRLYDKVIGFFFTKVDNLEMAMERAISFIISCFRWREGGSFSDIDFSREDMLCGYVFRYAPHGAGLARIRVLEAVVNCRELRSILKKTKLTVASLGGGPGNDAIGFCSALSRCKFAGNLKMLVVDSASQWLRYVRVSAKLLRQGGFGDASDLFQRKKVKLRFAGYTVPDEMGDLPMEETDVFLICKLISIMSWENKRDLVRNLYSGMKKSAFILLIDSPFTEDLWRDRFEILYLSGEHQEYSSGTRAVERFGHHDHVTSHARIAVLRKRNI